MWRVVLSGIVGAAVALGVGAFLCRGALCVPSLEDISTSRHAAWERQWVIAETSVLVPKDAGGLRLVRHSERRSDLPIPEHEREFSNLWRTDSNQPFEISYDHVSCHSHFVMEDPETGVRDLMASVLALSQRHEENLAKAGLRPYASRWWNDPPEQREEHPVLSVVVTSRIHGDLGGAIGESGNTNLVHPDARRILGWRMYMSLESGAALCVRTEVHPQSREVDVDFIYFDRSVCGVPYPGGTIEFEEGLQ